jgi:hypothetical protein
MLTANAITELDVESATYAVFAEWLAKYFDGATHDVGGNAAVTFPKAVILFGQSPMTQPLNPLAGGPPVPPSVPQSSITMVWGAPVSTVKRWETVGGASQQMAYKKVRWNFWVRCEAPRGAATNARKLCRQTAEMLSAILANPATTQELGQKGLHHCRPGEPEPVSEAPYILMLVSCRATLRYAVLGGNPQVRR